jgi:tetratricopeptide (TPR) repeat protein
MSNRLSIVVAGLLTTFAYATIAPAEPPLDEPPLDEDTYLDHDFSWAPANTPTDYQIAMARGDRHAIRAAELINQFTKAPGPAQRRQARYAAAAYEEAAKLEPDNPEPHYRAAEILHAHILASRGSYVDEAIARKVIHHWDEFDRLAPGDPRVRRFLFGRALIHTKLAESSDLERAIADYQRLAKLSDVNQLPTADAGTRLANEAEVHMMRGDLEVAIPLYERALQLSPNFSHAAGLAVALDRDRQGVKAREIMRAYAAGRELSRYQGEITKGNIFYVPAAEGSYYLGLIFEALGQSDQAIDAYERFIISGAHPRYHKRARENIADLRAAKKPGKRKQRKKRRTR